MQRYGMLIGIRPEKIDEYRRLHAALWPTVMEQIKRSNISYSMSTTRADGPSAAPMTSHGGVS